MKEENLMHCIARAAAALVLLATVALAGEVRTTLALSGLSCVTCSAAVTKALNQVAGGRARSARIASRLW